MLGRYRGAVEHDTTARLERVIRELLDLVKVRGRVVVLLVFERVDVEVVELHSAFRGQSSGLRVEVCASEG